jgi:hypothetical protein
MDSGGRPDYDPAAAARGRPESAKGDSMTFATGPASSGGVLGKATLGVLIVGLVGLLGGCPGSITIELPGGGSLDVPLPGADTVVVEVFNDTNFEVDPRIRFDDDNDFFAQLAPSEELATGILAAGESIEFTIDCERLGLIFSDRAGQFFFDETIGQADTTRMLERDDDFDCGSRIQFLFIGAEAGFGVVVSVDGVVVD